MQVRVQVTVCYCKWTTPVLSPRPNHNPKYSLSFKGESVEVHLSYSHWPELVTRVLYLIYYSLSTSAFRHWCVHPWSAADGQHLLPCAQSPSETQRCCSLSVHSNVYGSTTGHRRVSVRVQIANKRRSSGTPRNIPRVTWKCMLTTNETSNTYKNV